MRISDWSSDVCSSDLVSARGLERDPTCPETGHPEQRDAADLEYGHDDGQQPYRTVAGDVHEIGNDDQPDAQNRNQHAVRLAAERPQSVSPEGARDEDRKSNV